MFLGPDCTIEIVHANEELYKKLKNFRKNKSMNKVRSKNAKNHEIEVKEILDKKKIVETELQILKVQMDERIKTADWVNLKVSSSDVQSDAEGSRHDFEVPESLDGSQSSRSSRRSVSRGFVNPTPLALDTAFIPTFYAGAMKESDFLTVSGNRVGDLNWGLVDFSSEVEETLYQTLFAGLKICSNAFHPYSVANFRQLVLQMQILGGGEKQHNWGHSNVRSQMSSRRTYAMTPHMAARFRAHQLQMLANMCGGIADECEELKLNKAHDFLASKTTLLQEHTNERMQCERYAHLMAEVTGQELSPEFYSLQFNNQHNFFPAHCDSCTLLKEDLMGGDGFGNSISVLQLRGVDSWLYIAGEILGPESGAIRAIGVKAKIRTGDIWSIAGNARYSCVHGVVSSYPIGTHKPNCTRCRMTVSLRNGFGNPDLLALFPISV